MFKKSALPFAGFLLLFSVFNPETSIAQQRPGSPESEQNEHLFRRNRFKPVRIKTIDRPVRLHVGQTGYFSGDINIETVTLPIRSTWDFGDGAIAQGLATSHAYALAGDYTVKFKVWNSQSADSLLLNVRVEDPNAPARIVSVSIKQGVIDGVLQAQFNPVVVGAEPIDFFWTFGNGGHSSGTNPIQVFDEPGRYNIELFVENANGQDTCSFEAQILVQAEGDHVEPTVVTCRR